MLLEASEPAAVDRGDLGRLLLIPVSEDEELSLAPTFTLYFLISRLLTSVGREGKSLLKIISVNKEERSEKKPYFSAFLRGTVVSAEWKRS